MVSGHGIIELRNAISRIRSRLPYPIADPFDTRMRWAILPDGVLGRFAPIHSDTVVLSASLRDAGTDYAVSTAVHELRHRQQYLDSPARYAICAVPFLRRWMLEPSAVACEVEADRLIGLGGIRGAD